MYTNSYYLDNLMRQKDRLEDMIQNYQAPQPVNNYITTGATPSKNLLEWRVLNENEEVDNLYVQNKTLFINDNLMVVKDVDGKIEKWEVKKIYPIDKKDEKINQLEEEIKKLKERINNEHSKPNKSTWDSNESNGITDVNVEPKPKTTGRSVSK